MKSARRVSLLCEIVMLCAAAVLLAPTLGAQNPTDSRSAVPDSVAASEAPSATYTVLYNFPGVPGPSYPMGQDAIAQGRDGNLYSTTYGGGTYGAGGGTAFKITPSGNLSVLYNFTGTSGLYPESGLTLGTDGNFYGTITSNILFRMTPAGTLTVLHTFTGGSDGCYPTSAPIEGTNGEFYGTTAGIGCGFGTAYKVTSNGVFTALHTFTGTDGQYVQAGLVQGTDGNFYGDTTEGGTANAGVIFKMTPTGTITVLHNFENTDGCYPDWSLIQATDGDFYGTTQNCGPNGNGTVFKITPGGIYTLLYSLNGNTDGAYPNSGLVRATDGQLYGVTSQGGSSRVGTIYVITTSGAYSVLYNFDGASGSNANSPLRQNTNGILYGDTSNGGSSACLNGCGVFYSLNVGLKPFVTFVISSGKEGSTAQILGQGFTKATTVSFNGTPATIIDASASILGATVPAGATTGNVTVTTGSTTLTSNLPFHVTPAILSFSPPSGPVGTVVTITGTGLLQTSKVALGGKLASQFTVNSDTQITATVPTGAKTGKIALETPGGIGESTTNFTVN